MFATVDLRLANLFRLLPFGWQARIESAYVRLLSVGIGELHDPPLSTEEIDATRHLSIIVPVHNAPDDTQRCLRSLEWFAGEAEVIIVDDGSTDPRASRVVTGFAARNAWKVHRNETGNYHSGACSSGAALATRPVLCLLNSDTVVTQHAWSPCVQALFDEPALMAVGPRTSDALKSQIDLRARRCRFVWSDQQIFSYAQRLHRQFAWQGARRIDSFVSGAALFVRANDWDRVSGFDGCRRHLGNDVDLCRKLIANGGWLGVCDGAYIHHLGGRSTPFS